MLSIAFLACALAQPAPVTRIEHDDTRIASSCVVVVPRGSVVADANGNGVIQIDADGITVEFAPDSVLRGSAAGAAPDTYAGIGIAINGHKNVVLKNARVSGYKVGIRAEKTPGLTIDGADLSDNWRQHLHSTPKAEAGEDWLSAHHNDDG